jgi:hypothetical protein
MRFGTFGDPTQMRVISLTTRSPNLVTASTLSSDRPSVGAVVSAFQQTCTKRASIADRRISEATEDDLRQDGVVLIDGHDRGGDRLIRAVQLRAVDLVLAGLQP